jgi:hypothetical protein
VLPVAIRDSFEEFPPLVDRCRVPFLGATRSGSVRRAGLAASVAASKGATRPEGVVTALLEYVDGHGRLIAVWRDAETLEHYLAGAEVPRGMELMRKIGREPKVCRFDVLDLG